MFTVAELIKEFGENQKLQAKLNTKSSSTSKQSVSAILCAAKKKV